MIMGGRVPSRERSAYPLPAMMSRTSSGSVPGNYPTTQDPSMVDDCIFSYYPHDWFIFMVN